MPIALVGRQCLPPNGAALGRMAGSYLMIEFSCPVLTFDRQLDSHRRKKDRKNKRLDRPDLESGQ